MKNFGKVLVSIIFCITIFYFNTSSAISSSSSSSPIIGGGMTTKCNSLEKGETIFNTGSISLEITCKGNRKAKTFKLDCGNGETPELKSSTFVAGSNENEREATFTCSYKPTDITEYEQTCYVAGVHTNLQYYSAWKSDENKCVSNYILYPTDMPSNDGMKGDSGDGNNSNNDDKNKDGDGGDNNNDDSKDNDENGGRSKISDSNKECKVIDNILDFAYREVYISDFDDISNSEYKKEITQLEKSNVVEGTTPATFEPTLDITRAEFLKIVLKSHCYDYSDVETINVDYTDIDKFSWEASVIKKATQIGLIDPEINELGEYISKANEVITQIEINSILNRVGSRQLNYQNEVDLERSKLGEYVGIDKSSDAIKRDYSTKVIHKMLEIYR